MPSRTNRVSCPANQWTKVAEGSFWNLGRHFDMVSSNGVSFEWRWFGTGVPFFQQGSGPTGTSGVSIPPSTYWRLEIRPMSATTIAVGPGAGNTAPPPVGVGGGAGSRGDDRPGTRIN